MKCVLLLSAPRCGSSCTAACIHLCGAYLGKAPTEVKDQFNEKGYFENKSILKFNRECLKKIGLSWDNPSEATPDQNKLMFTKYKLLRQIITEEYDQDLCLIKDPRISILWPLYKAVLDDLGIEHPMILLRRDQNASVMSMVRMTKLNTGRANEVYEGCYSLIGKMKTDCPTHEVHFEKLLENPKVVMKGVCGFLGIPYGKQRHKLVVDFIEEGLVRY